MSKYKFTYFLNTACTERRPQTRRDLIEDWIVEEKEYPTALEAFEHAYIEILDNDEEDLQDLYEENGIGPDDEVKKLEALKDDFECIDLGDGSTILISIEGKGPIDSYDSGFTKESFNDDYIEDDEDYDDDEYLDENKKLNENIELKPDGGDKKNWFAFYTSLQGNSYSNNTQDNIAQFGKENLEGLKDLSIEEIKDFHMYWGSEYGFHSFYNGDTFILFDNIEKLPENMKKDAYECCKGYKKVKKEDIQLEIDEKGLPVLEKPYDIRERDDNRYQITSSHPYDMTDYSYAISKTNDINEDWEVYDPENPRTIVSDYSARKTTLEGTYKGWNEALEAMKRIDSNKTRRIDRT